jgi:hypothetical protein
MFQRVTVPSKRRKLLAQQQSITSLKTGIFSLFVNLEVPLHSSETNLLTSSCPPVHLSFCLHESEPPPTDGFPWNLILWNFMKICWEIPRLIKIGQKFGPLYKIIWVRFVVRGKKTRYSCESLDILLLFTVARGSTVHKERIVVFPFQQWLRERITLSGYTYGILPVFWQENMADRYSRTAE